jgi:hypothetical protein
LPTATVALPEALGWVAMADWMDRAGNAIASAATSVVVFMCGIPLIKKVVNKVLCS